MLSRSLGNKGRERKFSVKYSCNESCEDKAWAAVKAITYVLLKNLWLSANLSPFCYSAYKTCTHKAQLTRTAALLLMGSIIISVACVREYLEMWKVNQNEKENALLTWGVWKVGLLNPTHWLVLTVHWLGYNPNHLYNCTGITGRLSYSLKEKRGQRSNVA